MYNESKMTWHSRHLFNSEISYLLIPTLVVSWFGKDCTTWIYEWRRCPLVVSWFGNDCTTWIYEWRRCPVKAHSKITTCGNEKATLIIEQIIDHLIQLIFILKAKLTFWSSPKSKYSNNLKGSGWIYVRGSEIVPSLNFQPIPLPPPERRKNLPPSPSEGRKNCPPPPEGRR